MPFQEMLSNIGGFAVNILVMILGVLFFAGIVFGVVMAFLKYKKYSQFKCVIWGRDGFGQISQTKDRAGIFVDKKTKNKRFFLQKNNVGLDPDDVPYIQVGNQKIVYLLKTGLKNFQYIKPRVSNDMFRFDVGEEDVNWAVNAYERQKNSFAKNMLLQYLPFIALAFVSIIILILFIYFFKQFGVLKDVAEALKGAAVAFAQSQGGTVILE